MGDKGRALELILGKGVGRNSRAEAHLLPHMLELTLTLGQYMYVYLLKSF